VIVRFVDIGGIYDHHCLNFHNESENTVKTSMSIVCSYIRKSKYSENITLIRGHFVSIRMIVDKIIDDKRSNFSVFLVGWIRISSI